MNKKAMASNPILPFSDVVIGNGLAFVSGQVSIDENAKLVEGDIEEQTKKAFENLEKVLASAGLKLGDIVRTGCYLVNRDDLPGFNKIYSQYFTSEKPARSTIFISSLPIEGTIIEIDCIATINT